jgi:peptide/nickel transport system substrate-binding protein
MSKKKLLGLVAMLLVAVFVVAACGGGGTTTDTGGQAGGDTGNQATGNEATPTPPPLELYIPDYHDGDYTAGNAFEVLDELLAQFPQYHANPAPIIDGGMLRLPLVQATAFAGLLNPVFWTQSGDSAIMGHMGSSLFNFTPRRTFGQNGLVTFEHDADAMIFTMHMRTDLPNGPARWHDGVPVTLDDLVFALEVISHPDYVPSLGIRQMNANGPWLRGFAEFNAGEVDYIAGLVLSNNNMTLEWHLTEFPPALLHFGFWTTPMPRHHWEGIAVADMPDHPNSRTNLLGWGPFSIQNIVPGESVHYVRNEAYHWGRPNIESIILEVVNPEMLAIALAEGRYDIGGFRNQDLEDYGHINNIVLLGEMPTSQGFHTFRLGTRHHDDETGEIYFLPRTDNHPIMNRAIRRAIGYGMNILEINMTLGGGMSRPATSILHPAHVRDWMDPHKVGFGPHNPELAIQVLEEAGFTEFDADGYRLDLNGNPMYFNWSMTSAANNYIIIDHYIANMREIGLRVQAWRGGLHDFNYHMDIMDGNADMYEIHISTLNYGLGWNPDPDLFWGPSASFNRSRMSTPEMQRIIRDIQSPQAWNEDWLAERYREWEALMYYDPPAIPNNYGVALTAVNRRMVNYSIELIDADRATVPFSGNSHLWGFSNLNAYVNDATR